MSLKDALTTARFVTLNGLGGLVSEPLSERHSLNPNMFPQQQTFLVVRISPPPRHWIISVFDPQAIKNILSDGYSSSDARRILTVGYGTLRIRYTAMPNFLMITLPLTRRRNVLERMPRILGRPDLQCTSGGGAAACVLCCC